VPATAVYDLRRGALVSYSVPSFGQAKTVTLRGGFDCGYAVRAGTSIISGPLEIAGGLIIADGIAVR
jgi:hypothetical protein